MREKISQIQEIQFDQKADRAYALNQKAKMLCLQILRKKFIPHFKAKLLQKSVWRPTSLIYATLSLKKATPILAFFAKQDERFKFDFLVYLQSTAVLGCIEQLKNLQKKLIEQEKAGMCQTELDFIQLFFNYIRDRQMIGSPAEFNHLLSKEMIWSLQRSFQAIFSCILKEDLLSHWDIQIQEELNSWNEKSKILYHPTLNNEALYLHKMQLIASSEKWVLFAPTSIEEEIQNKISFQLFNGCMYRIFGIDLPFYCLLNKVSNSLQKEWTALLFKTPRITIRKEG